MITALMDTGFVRGLGFQTSSDPEVRNDTFLFGEAQGRILISVTADKLNEAEAVVKRKGACSQRIGHVTDADIKVDGEAFGNIRDWHQLYVNVSDTYLEK